MNALARQGKRPFPTITLMLLLIILLAYGLRLINLDAFSFWTDEGLTPLRAGYPLREILSNRIIIQEGITQDTHPALYYLIIHFTNALFGATDFAFRYPSLLASVLLVPLLYQFGRRLGGVPTGVLAALLTAVNPLQIYYADEARMYTLFVLLAAAASYALWRALQGVDLRRNLLLYLLLAGLAFYTHYTAVFLIAAQALFWAWLLWRAGYKKLLLGTAVIAVLLAIPVIPFTVPRLFTGAEANYFYVSPAVIFKDIVHFFGLGVTIDFAQWGVQLLNLLLLALLLVGLWAARSWHKRFFLLSYLLAVPLGLTLGSLLKPMYQGARHIMVSSPAFLLLLALGAAACMQFVRIPVSELKVSRRILRNLALAGAIMLILAPFLSALMALRNYYFDPAYAKNDFRGLIAYIEARAGDNDVIVYNNAILLPLHAHYRTRPDVAVTAAPIYPHPYGSETEAQLADLAQNYERIWFITDPPADKRDAEKQVRGWLDANLPVVDERAMHARTTLVNTLAYGAQPQIGTAVPENGRSLAIEWPELPALQGIETHFEQPAVAPTLWLDLFWDGAAPPPNGASLRFSLRGPNDQTLLVEEQGLARNSAVWPADGLVRQSYKLPLPPGAPPGSYDLSVQPIGADGGALGAVADLGEVELGVVERPLAVSGGVYFDNGLILRAVELYDTDVRPGHNLPLDLLWQAAPGAALTPDDLRYTLEVIAPDGSVLRTQEDPPAAPWLQTWPQAALLRERTNLYFYPETQPGVYRLRWRLEERGEAVAGRPFWRPWSREQVDFGAVEVKPWPLETEAPAAATAVGAQVGADIVLSGYEVGLPQENRLPLTVYWRATTEPAVNWVVFVHLVNADGEVVSQIDRLPVDGLRPTTGWRAGELLTDPYELDLPPDLPPGLYQINVGLYNPDENVRATVTLDGVAQPHHQVGLASVTLP